MCVDVLNDVMQVRLPGRKPAGGAGFLGAAEIFCQRVINHADQTMDLQQFQIRCGTVLIEFPGIGVGTAGFVEIGHQILQLGNPVGTDGELKL